MSTAIPSTPNPSLTSNALELIWRWNRTDLSEFDSTFQFQNDLGTASGTAVPTFVSDVFMGEPGIRFSPSTLVGGVWLPVKTSVATLVAPSVLVVRLASMSAVANLQGQVCLFGSDTAGVVRGLFFARSANGSANQDFRCVRNDKSDTSVASNCGTGAWDAATQNIGGEQYTFEYWRNTGAVTPAFAARLATQGYGTGTPGADAGGIAAGQFTLTDWASQDMPRFGLAAYGSASATGTVDFLDIALYKSSLDR